MTHLGLVGPVPPVQTGPADYLGNMLPGLAAHAELTVFDPDPSTVDPELRRRYRFRRLEERADPGIDALIYHVANNPWQIPAIDAALEGPAGILELHDASQHHLVAHRFADPHHLERYTAILEAAHGPAGRRLGELRRLGPGPSSELFLFDLLKPLLDRHLGVIVHNKWAAALVEQESPGTRTLVVPHFAPAPPAPATRAQLGLPAERLIVAHMGYVTLPKRPQLMLRAFAHLVRHGVDAQLVFGGAADGICADLIARESARLGIAARVTVTGYLPRRTMDQLMTVVDMVVNLRFPHLGESSGVLVEAMSAGRPVIAHHVGAWADLPPGVVVYTPLGEGEERGLVQAMLGLVDPAVRARVGAAGREFAASELSLDRCAGNLVRGVEAWLRSPRRPRAEVMPERTAAVAATLAGRAAPWLEAVPPADPGGRLLLVGAPALEEPLGGPWGYGVTAAAMAASPSAGDYAVVVLAALPPDVRRDPARPLLEAGLALQPGGLLILDAEAWSAEAGIDGPALERLLGASGLAPQPTAAQGIVAARKVELPEARYPAEFYARRWASGA